MISNATLGGLAFSLLLSALAPFAVYFALRRRMTLSWRNIGVGALIFVVFALVLEQLLHYVVLKADPDTANWFMSHKLALAVYGVLAAGVFEEVGRYVGLRFLVRPTGNPGTAVAYGLGHGGLETFLIGVVVQAQALVMALLANTGKLDSVLGGKLPPKTVAAIHDQFVHLTPMLTLVAGMERMIALALQIALTFLVWRAVQTRRIGLVFAAIAFHALADTGAALLQAGIVKSIWVAEGGALAVLVVLVVLLRRVPAAPGASAA